MSVAPHPNKSTTEPLLSCGSVTRCSPCDVIRCGFKSHRHRQKSLISTSTTVTNPATWTTTTTVDPYRGLPVTIVDESRKANWKGWPQPLRGAVAISGVAGAAEPDVRHAGVFSLRRPRGGAEPEAVVGRAQVGPALQHTPRDLGERYLCALPGEQVFPAIRGDGPGGGDEVTRGVVIGGPLPDVADNVVQVEAVRRVRADRGGPTDAAVVEFSNPASNRNGSSAIVPADVPAPRTPADRSGHAGIV